MRYSRIRLLWLVVLLLTLAVAQSCFAALYADYDPKVIWATYHGDMLRRGINSDAKDIDNPAFLNLIWVFPRATEDADDDEYKFIVDNRDPLFVGAGWRSEKDPEAWGYVTAGAASEAAPYSYYWTQAANAEDADASDYTGPRARATWNFPTAIPRGYYQVWVWVPPGPEMTVDENGNYVIPYKYTENAVYTVYHAQGSTNLRFDQTQGGTWQPLSVEPFYFTGSRALRVELTNRTSDTAEEIAASNIRVAADAIKFVPVTGQEIYSSPTSTEIDYTYMDPSDPTILFSGRIPVVMVGTIEQPFVAGANAPSSGAVYCINSVTPDNKSVTLDDADKKLREALAEKLGTPMWRYPRNFEEMTPDQVEAFLDEPNSGIEGPIENGIYSSPTLAHARLPIGSNPDSLMCIVTGMDRQTYGIDANTGELLWKGPGVTLSEDNNLWTSEPVAGSGRLRNDAFGGRYQWVKRGDVPVMTWDFTEGLAATGTLQANRSYKVYVWIPVAKGDETGLRAPDAEYEITYQGGSSKIKINQRVRSNQGRWVDLGSYFGVSKLTLHTSVSDDSTPDRIVVADAAMIVPDTIGSFGYCSAATDVKLELEDFEEAGSIATKAFVNTATEGRMICFDLERTLSNTRNGLPVGHVSWVYPAIRSSLNIENPNTGEGGDMPGLGLVGASPTFFNGTVGGEERDLVYLPTLGGTIHCVDAETGQAVETWSDTATPSEFGGTPGFTSSLTVGRLDSGDTMLFVGSVEGTFYAFKPDPLSLAKQYEANMPLGAFRYSTPSLVARDSSGARVWAPGSDGRIYALRANSPGSGTFLERLSPDNTPGFDEPSVLAPIQASPAFDGIRSLGTKNFITMYVGDMNGVLHWFDAMTGTSDWRFNEADPLNTDPTDPEYENYTGWQCEGALFSSPNITNFTLPSSSSGSATYVYVGCADGRLYAFSNYGGAWGGDWAGGHWPFRRPRGRAGNSTTRLAPDTDVQVDLFHPEFYDKSYRTNPHPMGDGGVYLFDKATWGEDWVVSPEMKMPESAALPTRPDPSDGPAVRAFNKALDDHLTKEAQKRRTNFVYTSAADRVSGEPIYFEWGETLNLVVWNLPALEFLSGQTVQSAANSISFSLANTSPGASAGSLIRQTGRVTLKEYVVLDKDKPVADIPNAYEALRYGGNTPVKRCYALAQIYLESRRNPPFSPGTGWTLVAEVKRKRTNDPDAPLITQRIPIARLILEDGVYKPDFDNEQLFGINNPLAIRDDQDRLRGIADTHTEVGWPNTQLPNPYLVDQNTRKDPEAHFNGNAELLVDADGEPYYGTGKTPFVNWQYVNHGTSSREAWLGVMDRSATGTRYRSVLAGSPVPAQIENLRINNPEIIWRGGTDAIANSGGIWFPWEFGPGSADYPHISRQRQEFRKASDDGLPTEQRTTLPPVVTNIPDGSTIGRYEGSLLSPETVYASLEVPRFQPANYNRNLSSAPMETDFNDIGYLRTMDVYVDSNNNGNLDRGNNVIGRPSTYQEVYRRFRVGLMVPPDPKIEVEESLVDVGIAPHGLGIGMNGIEGFSAFNPLPVVSQWFKPVTVKNAGNVNMPNMRVGNNIRLFSDQSSIMSPIPPYQITSSLDADPPFNAPPFTTVSSGSDLGFTLTKARVGDPDPSVMAIPDKRKWDMNFEFARNAAQDVWGAITNAANGTPELLEKPLPVKVSLRIPLTTPIGTYQSLDETFGLPYVPVFSDRDRNNVLSVSGGNVTEPVAQQSFQLKVTVRETQLTGGVTDTSLPHIDFSMVPRLGDATPAAYRDPATGSVFLVWSSNRIVPMEEVPNMSASDLASAPWFLSHATLTWDGGWRPVNQAGMQWWQMPAWGGTAPPYLPAFGWPDTLLGHYTDWEVLTWTGNSSIPSVRHHSPTFAQYTGRIGSDDVPKAWLAWIGTVDIRDPATNKVAQEHRIFYTDASNCNVSADSADIFAIEHDPAMVKRSPSLAVDPATKRLWTFWQGGDGGRWNLYCSANDTPENTAAWTPDMRLMVADSLSSVSSPNALLRRIWNSNSGGVKQLFDVVYSGGMKLGRASDVLLTRYNALVEKDVAADRKSELPSNKAQALPRIYGEHLERDSKFGFYASRHIAWMRAELGTAPEPDDWGGYDAGSDNPDRPFIRVMLPEGYPIPGGGTVDVESAVSATDGSVWERSGTGWNMTVDPLNVSVVYDEETGLYQYRYPEGSLARRVLGDMLADFSAGVVRFTESLSEVRSGDKFLSANVYADYTPRTWRLTTDSAVDNSPVSFIERTSMYCDTDSKTPDPNPGLGPDWRNTRGVPVDRLWVFWRKAAAGSQSSTIYYKTYRMGTTLSDLFRSNNVDANPEARYTITSVENALGPWEIDGSGAKVYFTEVDERYRSLSKTGGLGNGPGPVTINYRWTTGSDAGTGTLTAYDISWLNEMPEQSLLGFSADGNVNEGSIYAFADPVEVGSAPGTFRAAVSSKIWLFWTSTRSGTTDLFWETLSPEFVAR